MTEVDRTAGEPGPGEAARRRSVAAPDGTPLPDPGPLAGPPRERSTRAVLDSHLGHRESGDVEGDLGENYAHDVVVLSGCGVHRGHDGVRETARILGHYVGSGGGYDIVNSLVDGESAFIEWCADGRAGDVRDGADSFVIRDGRIVVQTIHYTTR